MPVWLQFPLVQRPITGEYANLLADEFPGAVADLKAAAAFVATVSGPRNIIAGRSGWNAFIGSERIKTETGHRYGGKAEAEPSEGLPPRYRLRHAFRQLIEFIIHNFSFLFVGF